MKIEININDYLSEEEKVEIAREAFASEIKRCVSKGRDGVFGDAESLRVVGNITYHAVRRIMEEYIPDFESQIRNRVKDIVENDNYSYYVFSRADNWGAPDSQAVKWIKEVVNESKETIINKAKEEIMQFAYKDAVRDGIIEYLGEQQSALYHLESVLASQIGKE